MADLPAGRELDAAVARVLGWSVVVPDGQEDWYDRQVTSWPCLIMYAEGGYLLTRTAFGDWEVWQPSVNPAAAIEALEAWANADDSRWFRIIRDDVFGRRCYIVELDASSDEWMAQAPTLAHAAALALVTASPAETSH